VTNMFCTCQNTREGAGIIGFGTLASYNFRLIIEGLSVFWKQLGKERLQMAYMAVNVSPVSVKSNVPLLALPSFGI
jgi:uncharacterized membrane protein